MERFDDMAVSGTRHPFYYEYKVALDENNKLLDAEITSYSNGGYVMELSKGVMGKK